jgi:hypothetical protein
VDVSQAKFSHLTVKQSFRRYRYNFNFIEGFTSADLGLWRRFERPAVTAVAADFAIIGESLRRHMERVFIGHAPAPAQRGRGSSP